MRALVTVVAHIDCRLVVVVVVGRRVGECSC